MTAQQHLNGPGFIHMVCMGHARLKEKVSVVNALNIFPVPDGDTGTNMELSLASGVAELGRVTDPSIANCAHALASGLLMGARGNSGVILSQLFRGFARVCQDCDALDVPRLAKALQEGVNIAYRAVAKPVEGTMLTVAREAAAAGVKESRRTTSLPDWMATVHQAAVKALEHTPEQLPVLKQAGVVDSGGQGLVYIFEGFLMALRGEQRPADSPTADVNDNLEFDFAAAHIEHEGEYGYCTEVLVRVEDADPARAQSELREQLAAYGDSLLVVGADDLVKVHVHTLHPGRVLEDAIRYGPLIRIKIDNMTEQHGNIKKGSTRGSTGHSAASTGVNEDRSGQAVKPLAVVAVAAGEGLSEIFGSLGVDVVLHGGQTMNPSTEEIVQAARSTNAETIIVLPNNKNIIMAAEQARAVVGDCLCVVPTTTIPEGISAMMAFDARLSAPDNVARMREAAARTHSGMVVRAVRDSTYQGRDIRANQYLGFANQELVYAGSDRLEALLESVAAMMGAAPELLTVFYGADVAADEMTRLAAVVGDRFGLELDARFGGQPIYDYIFSLE